MLINNINQIKKKFKNWILAGLISLCIIDLVFK